MNLCILYFLIQQAIYYDYSIQLFAHSLNLIHLLIINFLLSCMLKSKIKSIIEIPIPYQPFSLSFKTFLISYHLHHFYIIFVNLLTLPNIIYVIRLPLT